MTITIYTTATCPYCKMLKDYLSERGVEYIEKMVDQDDEAKEEMTKASGGFLGVPFTIIVNGSDTQSIIGFDQAKLESVLETLA